MTKEMPPAGKQRVRTSEVMRDSRAYLDSEFWEIFLRDIADAQARVLIHSPFITLRRVEMLQRHLTSACARHVAICAFIQEPWHWSRRHDPSLPAAESKKLQQTELAIRMLTSIGVHVSLRAGIHEKLAVIDRTILWEGSLNILSHYDTKERMRRWNVPSEIDESIRRHQLETCSECDLKIIRARIFAPANEVHLGLTLGSFLSQLRIRNKVQQKELSEKMQLCRTHISEIERGTHLPSLPTLNKIVLHSQHRLLIVPELLVPAIANLALALEERQKSALRQGAGTER